MIPKLINDKHYVYKSDYRHFIFIHRPYFCKINSADVLKLILKLV